MMEFIANLAHILIVVSFLFVFIKAFKQAWPGLKSSYQEGKARSAERREDAKVDSNQPRH